MILSWRDTKSFYPLSANQSQRRILALLLVLLDLLLDEYEILGGLSKSAISRMCLGFSLLLAYQRRVVHLIPRLFWLII